MNRALAKENPQTISQARSTPTSRAILQRQPLSSFAESHNHCACGGGCPRCQQSALLQPKLKISEPGDPYEQEADRIADQVMRMPEPSVQRQVEPEEEEEEMVQRKAIVNPVTPLAQRQVLPEMEEKVIQTKTIDNQAAPSDSKQEYSEVSPTVHEVIRLPGQPLDPATRAFMEPRFVHDFSQVRVHSGSTAEQSAREVNANAYTVGYNIVFGAGWFAPGTHEGRKLIAHELTHVVQQERGVDQKIRRVPADCKDKKRDVADADVLAKVNGAAADPAALSDLYLALKRARACFSDFDEAAFSKLVPEATKIYSDDLRKSIGKGYSKAIKSDDRKLVWAESLKPFAGYFLSGFDTANRLLTGENKRKLGGTLAPGHEPYTKFADKQNESKNRGKVQSAFSKANVLVFSGHQYAQYKLPGVWNNGNWDVTLDVRGIKGPLHNVKLLIGTSCATLCKEAYELWKTIFPDAIFLGAARSTPLKGSVLANAFVKNLPQDLLFDPGAPGLSSAISAWKSAVQETQTSAVRGGVLDIAAGTIEFWNGKAWESKSATDPDNKCKVKDDYSAYVPDPQTP